MSNAMRDPMRTFQMSLLAIVTLFAGGMLVAMAVGWV